MSIETLRASIDAIDQQILALFESRMALVKEIGEIKKQLQSPVLDTNREHLILTRIKKQLINKELEHYAVQLFETLMRVSKDYQQ